MATKRTKMVEAGAPFARAAAIVALDEDPGRVHVRVAAGRAGVATRAAAARLAVGTPYRPAEGDRVLVIPGDDGLYVIGVLRTSSPSELSLANGGVVRVVGDSAEIRDAEGRLVVRWEGGAAEVAAPAGDLTIAAPAGRVVLRSGEDVAIEAGRDLVQRAARRVEVTAGAADTPQLRIAKTEATVRAAHVEVEAQQSRLRAEQVSIVADRIVTTANTLAQSVERFELTATRIVERTRDAFRDASELAQTRVGRARTIVRDAFSLYSKRTSMASTEDTSIDGRRVLLG
jgi:hypothetical protein